jgi:UDP-glucose:(heptosyl)LPS alpha-1,3-glucosyltransferase
MRLAFVIYRYFPFGGLQRDMLRIAAELRSRGHEIRVYCRSWEGPQPDGVQVRCLRGRSWANSRRNEVFQRKVAADLAREPADAVVGFNKMPGLDIYFAGDGCFAEQALGRGALFRRGGRYRHFAADERAVFDAAAATRILLLTERQREVFRRHYDTPDARMVTLPPGVGADRRAPDDAPQRRRAMRATLGMAEGELALLFVGSGFRTKGLDRAITALATLRREQPSVPARLLVAGQDKRRDYHKQAHRQGVGKQLEFLGGREDVLDLMLAADVLVHPARAEAGGLVLLEAIAAGLPVVTTEVCGYAPHVKQSRAGFVLPEPFEQAQFDRALMRCIDGVFRADCREAALLYARLTDLYSLPVAAADQIERWVR